MPLDGDRAEVIHFAGRHRLSPALRDGAPVLVPAGAPGERCGWAAFFAAPARRRVAAVLDPEDPASFRTVPAAAASPAPGGGRAARAAAFAEARRFLAALRGRLPRA
jgi:hypothetical protein